MVVVVVVVVVLLPGMVWCGCVRQAVVAAHVSGVHASTAEGSRVLHSVRRERSGK